MIVNDLFIVQPMASFSGYMTYMQFGLGTEKGGVGGFNADGEMNTITQDPFVWAPMTEARTNYTGERVVEPITELTGKLAWGPVKLPAYEAGAGSGQDGVKSVERIAIRPEGMLLTLGDGTTRLDEARYDYTVKFLDADGNILVGGTVAVDGTYTAPAGTVKIAYVHDNQVIPQESLPTMVGKMAGIALQARARRIGVKYSQFAAFQSKQDYGIDFESTISQQAQAELQFQTDSEAVFLIKNAADKYAPVVTWVDELLDTISYSMKAEGFAKKIEEAKMAVYRKTGRYLPNWMLVSPEMMPIMTFVPGFTASNSSVANGPYVAGNIANMKVIVSPSLGMDVNDKKVCYLGVLGADGKTATGVYAPYMPIVPTQLLGFADGTMEQGFSSMYDMKILNPALLAKIVVKDGNDAARISIFQGADDTI